MENKIKIKPLGEYEFSFEINDEDFYLELTEQELHLLSCNCAHLEPDGAVFKYVKTKSEAEIELVLLEETKQALRAERQPLLEAWDILIGNVNFGAIIISEEEHTNLINWRQQALDLVEQAIKNPPAIVVQFKK